MIDFHTHILPGIDDGSRDIGMSAQMLTEEVADGAGLVVATPHFYASRISSARFLRQRDQAKSEVDAWISSAYPDGPAPVTVLTGAEVYYFPGIGSASSIHDLCISGTDTLLLEMPFAPWSKEVLKDVRDLLEHQHLTIVLAHVERYIGFQKDRGIWNEVFAMPVIPQINAGSFLKEPGLFRRNKTLHFCLDFITGHPQFILGSDCHNMNSRRPNLKAGAEELIRLAGESAWEQADRTVREVLAL